MTTSHSTRSAARDIPEVPDETVLRRAELGDLASLLRDRHTFTGWGRAAVDGEGHYTFTTVDPGATEPGRAPFIALVLFARGLVNKLHTRIYLPDDAPALGADPLLRSLTDEERATLVATREPNGDLRFDVRLQGEGETVFLTFPRHRP